MSGAELRQKRLLAGVKGVEVARQMEVHPSTVTRIERATRVRGLTANTYLSALAELQAEQLAARVFLVESLLKGAV